MRESICTLPVVDVFLEPDGCPICKMTKIIEGRITDYILGAAMMEPDIRIETNKSGFCNHHYNKLLEHRGKLQLALILESHFDEVEKLIKKNDTKKLQTLLDDCFICNKINWGLSLMLETIRITYEKDGDFRRLFATAEHICPHHAIMLTSGVSKKNMKSYHREFIKEVNNKALAKAQSLKSDITGFTRLFDYRNAENKEDEKRLKNAPYDAIDFITKK